MKRSLIIVSLFLFCISCKKSNVDLSTIDGAWIESSHKKDTLYFDSSKSLFILGRGKELTGVYLLPKIYAGPYIYETKNDSISIQYTLSSLYKPTTYNFNIDLKTGKLKIGNFYVDSLNKGTLLTFIKTL
jgi:hypothetical protein